MLNLNNLSCAAGHVDCVVEGESVRVSYRRATTPEVINARFRTPPILAKLQALKAEIAAGDEPTVHFGAYDFEILVEVALPFIVDVSPLAGPQWSDADFSARRAFAMRLPEAALYEVMNGAIARAGLVPESKKNSAPTSE